MENTFKLIVRTPDQTVFDGMVSKVHLATEGGEMEAFTHHSSLTATISFSPVEIVTADEKEESYLVRNGMFLFDNETNTAILLALHCQHRSEISHPTIQEYAEFIDRELKNGTDLSDFQILYLKGEKLAVEQQIQETAK